MKINIETTRNEKSKNAAKAIFNDVLALRVRILLRASIK